MRRSAAELAERILNEIVDAAERVAEEIRREARAAAERYAAERRREADRYYEERRREADRLVDERARSLGRAAAAFREQAERVAAEVEALAAPPSGDASGAPAAGERPDPVHAAPDPERPEAVAPPAGPRPVVGAPGGTAWTSERAGPDVPEAALLRVAQMAVAGRSREEINRTLRGEFDLPDAGGIVDEILGPGGGGTPA